MEDKYLKSLLARLDLTSTTKRLVARTVFAGYHPQIEELMSLDLASEEVGTAFLPLGSPNRNLRVPTTLSLY